MTKTTEPRNFFAIIKKGALVAAQVEEVETILDDDGVTIISERSLGAKPVTENSATTLAAISAAINAASIVRVTELQAEVATKETEKTDAIASKEQEKLDAIAAKETALTALQVAANEKDAALALAAENLRILKEAKTLEDLAAAKAEVDRPEIDKKKAALVEEIAAKQAELDALN